jgi:hypothetical protein
MGRRAAVVASVVMLAGGADAAMAVPILPPAAITRVRGSIVEVRVRVPRGILAGVPTGGDPYFGSRPIFYPAPPVLVLAPPIFVPAPVYELAPIDFGPCFVPTEHTSQLGYWGSCPESYLRQYYLNRPD